MSSGKRRRLLPYLFLTVLGVVGCRLSPVSPTLTPSPTLSVVQSGCIGQVLGNVEIVASREMDVDWDRDSELVVLYMSEDKYSSRVAVIETVPVQCKLVCDEQLTFVALRSGERLTITLLEMEAVELTGDGRPELHIWLDRGGGVDENVEYHAILTPSNGKWQHVLGSTGITRSPSRPLFEFRDAPSGEAKDIYLESYYPMSGETRYTIMRWDGSKFMPVEGDVINVSTTSPWWNACCIAVLVSPVILTMSTVLVFAVCLRKARHSEFR